MPKGRLSNRLSIPSACLLIFALAAPQPGAAQETRDLAELSLEELMNMEVTTVSKKAERRADAADAVYVLTGEDIRRAGVTTIADALRLVPGMQVARVDSHTWAIGIRGFASPLARSILVLIDGRSVYNPLFAGTYWDIQDTFLEDIDRIEVIRGPGGTLWGANAFNGVINIITKNAAETQGGMAIVRGGTEEHGFGAARFGGTVGQNLHYRAYAKAFNRDGGYPSGGSEYDDWWMARGGFRADWRPQIENLLTLQGDIYQGQVGTNVTITEFTPPFQNVQKGNSDVSGGNLLGRWKRAFSPTSDSALQLYYDNTFRRDLNFTQEHNTFDIEWQHRFVPLPRHEVVWGLNYRVIADNTAAPESIRFTPRDRTDHLFGAFLEDEIAIIHDVLHLTLGSKFEHNDYSGLEVQPNARLLWRPFQAHTFWASIGRAVRTPTRLEHDFSQTAPPLNIDPAQPNQCLPAGDPCLFPRIVGNGGFDSEKVIAYQVGHRMQLMDRVNVDSVVFYHDYDDLLSVGPGTPFPEDDPPPPHAVLPLPIGNKVHGYSYGVEVAADIFATDRWRVYSGYSFLHLNIERDSPAVELTRANTESSSPQHQAFARSQLDLPWNLRFDANARFVDALPRVGIRSYFTFDVRIALRVTPSITVSLVGQDLWDSHHREFPGGTQVQRSGYAQLRYQW
jgi:iron complex outermembrane receptor protein